MKSFRKYRYETAIVAAAALLITSLVVISCVYLNPPDPAATPGVYLPPRRWSGGVVLAELFAPPRETVEKQAFDLLLDHYPSSVLGVLVYHFSWGTTINSMASPASIDRASYYGIRAGSRVCIDGIEMPPGFHFESEGNIRNYFHLCSRKIDRELKLVPPVQLDLEVTRDGALLNITTEVKPIIDLTGFELWLRIALAEKEIVTRIGYDRQEVNRMVIRHMVGGWQGFLIDLHQDSFTVISEVNISRIEDEIFRFLADEVYRISDPALYRETLFRGSDINEENLAVVAFVQREPDRYIIQARVVDSF